ncbi:Intraflagellar transport protein 46 [Nowakowskiella sp. JEL0407]|nr:Intraflagellar transport protein 46 [Nowakowskiella sp. JEL0407]
MINNSSYIVPPSYSQHTTQKITTESDDDISKYSHSSPSSPQLHTNAIDPYSDIEYEHGVGGDHDSNSSNYDPRDNQTTMNEVEDLKELLMYITKYKPHEMDLEPELKPFIPEYIPSIGDIDAFIKIPQPNLILDAIGLQFLDEPSGHQTDPSVLDLKLRSLSKMSNSAPQNVRSIPNEILVGNKNALDSWLTSLQELHNSKPAPAVEFQKRMPDIEDLMQVWDPEIEEALETNQWQMPSAELDVSVHKYIQIVSVILDIPIYNTPANERSRATINSLFTLFTLYSEFKNSHHFKALDSSHLHSRNSMLGAAPAAENPRISSG